ncbi:MAG: DUF2071 domain-containing protein, partial [Verrucomicrobiales bacterium]
VELAKRSFHLPYRHASMKSWEKNGFTHYRCRRRRQSVSADYCYRPTSSPGPASPGSLDFFLTERYLLYSATEDGRLFSGRVHHPPYQLASCDCPLWSTAPTHWNGLNLPPTPAESILYVDRVDVSVSSLLPSDGSSPCQSTEMPFPRSETPARKAP